MHRSSNAVLSSLRGASILLTGLVGKTNKMNLSYGAFGDTTGAVDFLAFYILDFSKLYVVENNMKGIVFLAVRPGGGKFWHDFCMAESGSFCECTFFSEPGSKTESDFVSE